MKNNKKSLITGKSAVSRTNYPKEGPSVGNNTLDNLIKIQKQNKPKKEKRIELIYENDSEVWKRLIGENSMDVNEEQAK